MKKVFFTFMLFAACVTSVLAQGEKKNQLSLGWGLGSVPMVSDVSVTIGTLGDTSYGSDAGAFSLQYLRFVTPKLGLGAIASLEHQSGKVENLQKEGKKDIGQTDVLIMPCVSYYWYSNRVVGIYSKAAAGVDLIDYVDDTQKLIDGKSAEFAYQLSPAGVDVGGPSARFFAEFGFGYQGIINMGVHFNI